MKQLKIDEIPSEEDILLVTNHVEGGRKLFKFNHYGLGLHLPQSYCVAKGLKAGDIVEIKIKKKEVVNDDV